MQLNAKTNTMKFLQIHQEFAKVKNNLVEVSMIDKLSNDLVIGLVVSKLPDMVSKTRGITYKEVNMIQDPKPKLLDVFSKYMDMERRIQKDLSKLEAETIPASKVKAIGTDSTKPEGVCWKCLKPGHNQHSCPTTLTNYWGLGGSQTKGKQNAGKVNMLSSTKPVPCPSCKGLYEFSKDGNVLYKTRLSSCQDWQNMGPEERSCILVGAYRCSLCTDFTGGQ